MGMDRREFIRIAGLSTLLGLGGKGAFELLAPGRVEAEIIPAPGFDASQTLGHGDQPEETG